MVTRRYRYGIPISRTRPIDDKNMSMTVDGDGSNENRIGFPTTSETSLSSRDYDDDDAMNAAKIERKNDRLFFIRFVRVIYRSGAADCSILSG